jgi:SAM-dependent methyltransferase
MSREEICVERTTCRICQSSGLLPVIDLGEQYVASIFVKDGIPDSLQRRYPLELVRCCGNSGCGLVQLRHSFSPSVLYSDYGYRSGINQSMRDNLLDIATKAEQMVELKAGQTVLDIGCNDGTLLCSYQTIGIDRLGFDPAENVVQLAQSRGLDVVNDYFSLSSYAKARPSTKAKVVTSIAMFYDLEDPRQFARDVASVLADDGVWVIELSYLPFMLQKKSFDTICHEHLEYYALKQIDWMLEREQLQVHKIEFNDVNGGSFRLFIRKKTLGCVPEPDRIEVGKVRTEEKILGLDTDRPYALFRDAVLSARNDLVKVLTAFKNSGKSVYVYGASTKGNTILQFCRIDKTLVAKAADRNPDKWERRTLGTDIPIVSEDEARAECPDYFLVLPWHFFSGFVKREAAFLARGGKFIIPLPEVRIVGKDDL